MINYSRGQERKERLLETVPETIRVILSEYLRKK